MCERVGVGVSVGVAAGCGRRGSSVCDVGVVEAWTLATQAGSFLTLFGLGRASRGGFGVSSGECRRWRSGSAEQAG